ncbi:hypothetical protein BJX99DRAFT_270185 [Aspergillus californicus]
MPLLKWYNQWPGGIPSYIRRHEQPVDDVEASTRAWRHFVREQWTETQGVAADRQRRALVERWATADQELRDSYGCQAPEDEPGFEDTENDACLVGHLNYKPNDVYICFTAWTPEKQALLAKCIVALFSWDGSQSHLTQDMSMLLPFEENGNTNQGDQDIVSSFKFRQSVARPNFLDMHMAQDGTVLFTDDAPKLIIDDRTLETGLALWVEFATNGAPERAYRSQILIEDFAYLFLEVYSNMDPLRNVLDQMGEDEEHEDPDVVLEDQPVDMRRPFAEVYIVGTYDGENGHEQKKEELYHQLDRYVPGFREAEDQGNGLAIGYALERILADKGGPLRITDAAEDYE